LSAFVLAGISGGASAALTLDIDDFTAGAQSVDTGVANPDCSSVLAPVVGGERDVCASKLAGAQDVEVDVPVNGNYAHSQNNGTFGSSEAVWDGIDDDPAVGEGLGLDLSGCEVADQRFELGVASVNLGTNDGHPEAILTVYDGATAYAQTVTLQEKAVNGVDTYDFPFADFVGFDFETTTVTAISLKIDGEDDEATDVALAYLKTCQPTNNGNGNGKKVPAVGLVGAGILGLSLAAFGAVAGFRRRG
jgi:hypothetical protein